MYQNKAHMFMWVWYPDTEPDTDMKICLDSQFSISRSLSPNQPGNTRDERSVNFQGIDWSANINPTLSFVQNDSALITTRQIYIL